MSVPRQSRRILLLVRLLTATGLVVVIATLTAVGIALSSLKSERQKLTAEQQQLNQSSDDLRQFSSESRAELQSILDASQTVPVAGDVAIVHFTQAVGVELKSRPDASVLPSLIALDRNVAQLVALGKLTHKWRANYDLVWNDITAQRTINAVRNQIAELRDSVNMLEGQQRLDRAIRYRRWRHTDGPTAAPEARELLTDEARRQSEGSTEFNAQLAEFSRLVEVLGGEEQLDSLGELKDNQLQSLLDRMGHSVAILGKEAGTSDVSPASIKQFKVAVFGEGFTADPAHQSIVPGQGGLFSLRRNALQLRREHERLVSETVNLFEAIDRADSNFAQSANWRTAMLAQQMEKSLEAGWRRMLIIGTECSMFFLWLALMISRGINGQVSVIEQARAESEAARQASHQLMLDQQAAAQALAAAHLGLQSSERRFRTLSVSAPIAIFESDASGGIVYANPQWLKIIEMSMEDSLGDGWGRALHPADCGVAAEWTDAASGGQDFCREFRFGSKVGNARWVSTRTTALRSEDGKVMGHVGTAEDITERKRAETELETVHMELLETSRHAGMAEVATGVLHNVGNVLNSVNTSSTLVADSLKKSRVGHLQKVVSLLKDRQLDLGSFITNDPAGKQIPAFLSQLADYFAAEQAMCLTEVLQLQKNVEHIKEIVNAQQTYAGASGFLEPIDLRESLEDAMRIHVVAITRHDISVVKECAEIPCTLADRHKVLQILVNLISNAKHAMVDSPVKTLTVRVYSSGSSVRVSVQDTGYGITPENLTRVFAHGFTTKKDGHGFGLHSGCLAARELGGALIVQSEGPGKGAVFTLELPAIVNAVAA